MVKVRGFALADPTVVGLVKEFIIASWASFDEAQAPDFMRDYLWPRGVDYDHSPDRSNVYVFMLDPAGEVVHVFDPRPKARGEWEETYAPHVAAEIAKGIEKLGGIAATAQPQATEGSASNEGNASSRTVRITSALEPKSTSQFNRPIVEDQGITDAELVGLAFPESAKEIDASFLRPLFAHIYPPGIPDRVDFGLGERNLPSRISGRLSLSPAGSSDGRRHAVLEGELEVFLGGERRAAYEGKLEIVLEYGLDDASVRAFEGAFRGRYASRGPQERSSGGVRFGAVFEMKGD